MKRIYKYISHCASALLRTLSQASVPAALALALLFTPAFNSCHKVEIDPDLDGEYVIAFDEVTTKAIINDGNLTSFIVWGETERGTANIFNGVEVIGSVPNADGKMTKWTYGEEHTAYWQENTTYDFFAIAPFELGTDVEYGAEKGWSVDYNIVESMVADDQVDFILAQEQKIIGTITSQPDPVKLSFTHKLSKVKLKLKKDIGNATNTITLKEVYIYGMKGNGTYYLDSGWSLGTNVAGISLTNLSLALGTDYIEIGEALMIPQELGEDSVYLIASFDYTNNGVTTPRMQIAPIPISTIDKWEESNTYTYAAVLSVEHDIVFEGPTIQNWLSHSEGGTIVIK